MSLKTVRIVTPGGKLSAQVPLGPNTTAAEALRSMGLHDTYFLTDAQGETLYQPGDRLDAKVKGGATLYATRGLISAKGAR
jgi:hypothetical protein